MKLSDYFLKFSLTFPKAFKNAPVVVVTKITHTGEASFLTSLSNITTTGVNFYLESGLASSWSTTPRQFCYIAIDTIAIKNGN